MQGSEQPNGTFKATKIQLQPTKNVDGKVKVEGMIFGPVTVQDVASSRMRVLNTTVVPRPNASFVEFTPTPAD